MQYCRVECGDAEVAPSGSLSDTDFEYPGGSGTFYTIDAIWGGVVLDSNLHLALDTAMPQSDWETLTLHIGDATFPLSEAQQKPDGQPLESGSPGVSGTWDLFSWFDDYDPPPLLPARRCSCSWSPPPPPPAPTPP